MMFDASGGPWSMNRFNSGFPSFPQQSSSQPQVIVVRDDQSNGQRGGQRGFGRGYGWGRGGFRNNAGRNASGQDFMERVASLPAANVPKKLRNRILESCTADQLPKQTREAVESLAFARDNVVVLRVARLNTHQDDLRNKLAKQSERDRLVRVIALTLARGHGTIKRDGESDGIVVHLQMVDTDDVLGKKTSAMISAHDSCEKDAD